MIKNQKLAFDVDALGAYVDENQEQLRYRQVAQGRSVSLLNVQDGYKGTTRLKLIDDTITWQDGTSCVSSAAGATVLTDKTLTTADITLFKGYCVKDLIGTWGQVGLTAGASEELKQLPQEAQLLEYILAKHQLEVDRAIWKGDTDLTNNYQFFNGFIKLINASADVIEANNGTTPLTAITVDNAYGAVLAVVRNMPEEVLEAGDAAVFCGRAIFDKVKDNLFKLNLYNVAVANNDQMALTIPATGITLYAVPGLNNTNGIYGGRRSEFIVGTDLTSDFSSVEVFYERKDDSIYVRNRFRMGVQFPFDDQLVKFTLAAS